MKRTASVRRQRESRASMIQALAQFRYQIRQFLRFSEKAARVAGITPRQHQLLLGVAGFTGRGWATISELADFLQERHNTTVELVKRAQQKGYLNKRSFVRDRRFVRVQLTRRGRNILNKLSTLHRRELARFQESGRFSFGLGLADSTSYIGRFSD